MYSWVSGLIYSYNFLRFNCCETPTTCAFALLHFVWILLSWQVAISIKLYDDMAPAVLYIGSPYSSPEIKKKDCFIARLLFPPWVVSWMKEGQSFAIRCFWYQKKYNICDQLHTPPCQNLSHLFRIGRKSIINQTDTARERKHNIYIFLLGSVFQNIRFGLDLSLTWTFGAVAMWHQHFESLNGLRFKV